MYAAPSEPQWQGERVAGGTGGIAPPDFGRSVIILYLNQGADYAYHIITPYSPPPDFQTFLWPYYVQHLNSIAL